MKTKFGFTSLFMLLVRLSSRARHSPSPASYESCMVTVHNIDLNRPDLLAMLYSYSAGQIADEKYGHMIPDLSTSGRIYRIT